MALTSDPVSIHIEAAGQGYEAPLPPRAVLVGKAEGCDLRLQGAGVAAEHCRIEPLEDGRHFIRDLGTGYATRVNGSEIQQVSLQLGDRIEVGDVVIHYGHAAPTAPPPSPPAENGGSRRAAPGASRPAAPPGKRDLVKPLLVLALAAVAAIVAAVVIGSGGEDLDTLAAERRLDDALDEFRARNFDAASGRLADLLEDDLPDGLRKKAERYRRLTQDAIEDGREAVVNLWDRRLDIDTTNLQTQRSLFVREHGPAVEQAFNDMIAKVRGAQAAWRGEETQVAAKASEKALERQDFRTAKTAWTDLRNRSTVGVSFDAEVEAGLQVVGAQADQAAEALLAEAGTLATENGPSAAVAALRAKLVTFSGTEAQLRLRSGIERWEREARKLAAAVPEKPETTTPTQPTTVEIDKSLRDALIEADALAEKRRFEAAAARIRAAIGEAKPESLPQVVRRRLEDLDLAALGLQALAEDIETHPERYRRVQIRPAFFVTLEGADAKGVTGALRGARTTYTWATLPSKALGQIVARAQVQGEKALHLAGLLRPLGDAESADRRLVQAVEGGVPSARVFALLARWRDEDVPEGGYVAWEGRYVTPRDRRRLERLARIADLSKKASHRDPKIWKPAADALIALGSDGKEALAALLLNRRTTLIETLAKHKDFTSGRVKAKLYQELEKRRAHALELIQDAQAWPYPNPSDQNTAEVAKRVSAVEEIWKRPFRLIAGWNENLGERLKAVEELDAFHERADPSFKPDLDALAEKVDRAVDMPAFTPDSKSTGVRQYSLKVLAYNETVDTTSTREEKENVRAVNEYRMMMGRRAVKIHERLVRGARGHSRHMKENNYFAHDVPARFANAQNRSPGHRAKHQGYGGGVGENIARGTWSGRDAFAAWFTSSGHHRNMINRGWTEMGAGRSGSTWWTQLFGAMTGRSLKAPEKLPDPPPAFAPEPEDDRGRPLKPGRPEVPDAPPPSDTDEWDKEE